MDFLSKFGAKSKIKYSALLAGFLAIVLTIIVVFNSIISILGSRYNLFFDMTDEQFYSASDEFVSTIERVNQKAELEIIFFDERDTVSNDHASVNGAVGLAYVHQTAIDLSRKLDGVTVSYHSTDEREFVNQFRDAGVINEKTVIIRRTTGEGSQFEAYLPSSFYAFDETGALFAYNGEVKLLEAIIRLSTDDEPTVYFTASHGETGFNLAMLFENAGFVLKEIDLTEKIYICECGLHYSPKYDFGITNETEREPVTAGSSDLLVKRDFECECGSGKVTITDSMLKERTRLPSNARAVVINEPVIDFEEKELVLLESYLSSYGAVLTFLNHEAKLDTFYEWLKVWGGIGVNYGKGVSTTSLGETSFKGYIPENDATKTYFSDLLSLQLSPFFKDAVTLELDPRFLEGNIDTGFNVRRTTTELVRTPSNIFFDGKAANHTLMAITKSESYLANPDETIGEDEFTSYLFVSTSGFASLLKDETSANTNTSLMRSLIRPMTGVQIYSSSIDMKVFNSYALDISGSQAVTFFLISMLALPLICTGVGAFVIIRRKRR